MPTRLPRQARDATLAVAVLASALLPLVACDGEPGDTRVEPERVVLVHGLGRTRASMTMLGARLSAAGFEVANVGYPSTRESLEELVHRLRREVDECCSPRVEDLHFVTHSMGGILVRRYLARYSPQHRGRIVMLSPPSQGSEIIDAFAESPLLLEMLGPMGARLGTDSLSLPNQLGPAEFELGIIAGNRSLNIITSWLIPGPDDGKVSVERARLQGTAHFLVVPATHTFIMNRRDVADQTAFFLRNGRFSADSLAAEEADSSEVLP